MDRILNNRYISNLRDLGIFSKFSRGAGYALIIYVVNSGVGYLVQVILANWLGATQYGQLSYALVWAQVLAVLASLGLGRCVVRFLPTYLDKAYWQRIAGLLKISQRLPLLAGVVISTVSTTIILLLPITRLDSTSLILGVWLIPIIAITEVRTQIVRCTQRIALALTPQMLVQPLALLIILFSLNAVLRQLKSPDALVAYGVSYALTLLIQFVIIRRVIKAEKSDVQPAFDTQSWLRVSLPLLFVSLSFVLLSRLDIIMIGQYLDPEFVGIYSAASKSAIIIGFLMVASNAILAPMVSHYFGRGEIHNLQNVVSLASILVFVPTLVIVLIVLPFSNVILGLFGANFLQGRSAFIILMIGQILSVILGPVGVVTNMTGHERESAYVFGFTCLINLLLNALSIPRFGITGAALSYVASMLIWKIWLSVLINSRINIRCWTGYAIRSLMTATK